MLGRFGTSYWGGTEYTSQQASPHGGALAVACVGDGGSHGGTIATAGQDGTYKVAGLVVAVDGAIFNCSKHGAQAISSVISRTKHNGKLLITSGAVAGCGAVISPPDRNVYAG